MKPAGKLPVRENRPLGFDAAGAGNRSTVRLVRHSQRKRGATDRLNLRGNGASPRPSLDEGESRNGLGISQHRANIDQMLWARRRRRRSGQPSTVCRDRRTSDNSLFRASFAGCGKPHAFCQWRWTVTVSQAIIDETLDVTGQEVRCSYTGPRAMPRVEIRLPWKSECHWLSAGLKTNPGAAIRAESAPHTITFCFRPQPGGIGQFCKNASTC